MGSKGQKYLKYDRGVKELIIREMIENHRGYQELANEYGIPEGTIATWIYQYRKRGELTRDKAGRPVPGAESDYKEKYEILKKFMAFCEKVDRKRK